MSFNLSPLINRVIETYRALWTGAINFPAVSILILTIYTRMCINT